MRHASQASVSIPLELSARRQFSTGNLLQKLIDDTPAAHRELVAYAIYYAYLSIRFPEIETSPGPTELTTLSPGHNRYIALNDAIFIFDFSPPTLRPRSTLLDAVRSRRASIYLFTQPNLVAGWSSRVGAWRPKIRNRIDIRTVPSWLCMGIGLMTISGWTAERSCLRKLINLTNSCLASFPDVNARIVTHSLSKARNYTKSPSSK